MSYRGERGTQESTWSLHQVYGLFPHLSHPLAQGAGMSQDHRNLNVHEEGFHRDPIARLTELGPSLCPLLLEAERLGFWGTVKGDQGRWQREDTLHPDSSSLQSSQPRCVNGNYKERRINKDAWHY